MVDLSEKTSIRLAFRGTLTDWHKGTRSQRPDRMKPCCWLRWMSFYLMNSNLNQYLDNLNFTPWKPDTSSVVSFATRKQCVGSTIFIPSFRVTAATAVIPAVNNGFCEVVPWKRYNFGLNGCFCFRKLVCILETPSKQTYNVLKWYAQQWRTFEQQHILWNIYFANVPYLRPFVSVISRIYLPACSVYLNQNRSLDREW